MKITTADYVTLGEGDRAFNHYDGKAGYIGKIDDHAQPDTMKGQSSATPVDEWDNHWFRFMEDGGGYSLLDGSRICSVQFAQKKGWL